MAKDFSEWHGVKSRLDAEHRMPRFREREIWWCSLGLNVGTEQNGTHDHFERPVLVFRKFNLELFWALPLTTKDRSGIFYHSFMLHQLKETLLLSQMRLLSAKRLLRCLGRMDADEFRKTNEAFLDLLKESDPLRGPRGPEGPL